MKKIIRKGLIKIFMTEIAAGSDYQKQQSSRANKGTVSLLKDKSKGELNG
jgi:hypothetical protein